MSTSAFSVFNKFLEPTESGIDTKETIRIKESFQWETFFLLASSTGNAEVKTPGPRLTLTSTQVLFGIENVGFLICQFSKNMQTYSDPIPKWS